MMLLHYIVLSSCLLGLMTWMMVQTIRLRNLPPDSDDGGGAGPDGSLPVVIIPPGSSLSDWLTDRMPDPMPLRMPQA